MQGVRIWQKIIAGEGRGFFLLPHFFCFVLRWFCGAAVPCCAFYFFAHTTYQKNKLSTNPTWGMYVRQPPAMRHMWRPSCFLLNHGGGALGNIKSPVCNYDNNKKTIFNHGPLSASHSNLMYFSFLSERIGRRRSPAERSALYVRAYIPGQHDLYELDHVAVWEPYHLQDLGHVSWVGSVLHRSCTASHTGRLEYTIDDVLLILLQ